MEDVQPNKWLSKDLPPSAVTDIFEWVTKVIQPLSNVDLSVTKSMQRVESFDLDGFTYQNERDTLYLATTSQFPYPEEDGWFIYTNLYVGYRNFKVCSVELETRIFSTKYFVNDENYDRIFSIYKGDEKYLISKNWVDKIQLEEAAFQDSVTSSSKLNLGTIYDIMKIVGMEK